MCDVNQPPSEVVEPKRVSVGFLLLLFLIELCSGRGLLDIGAHNFIEFT